MDEGSLHEATRGGICFDAELSFGAAGSAIEYAWSGARYVMPAPDAYWAMVKCALPSDFAGRVAPGSLFSSELHITRASNAAPSTAPGIATNRHAMPIERRGDVPDCALVDAGAGASTRGGQDCFTRRGS